MGGCFGSSSSPPCGKEEGEPLLLSGISLLQLQRSGTAQPVLQQLVLGHFPHPAPSVSTHTKAQALTEPGCSVCKGLPRESKGFVLSGKGSQAPPPPSRFISAIVIKALTKWFSCLSLLFNLLISYFSEVHYHPEAGNWELGLCGFSRLHLCFR